MITEYGLPRKVLNIDEALKFINRNNGIKPIYKTVYKFKKMNNKKPNYDSAIIDKLFFDFDDDNCWEEANKLHQYCLKNNIKHYIIMSGRGYHCFILCNPHEPTNIKANIYNAQHFFIDKLGLHCDNSVIGDNARLCRVPNTYNLKAKRFCIPLTKEQFEKGDIFCKVLATKQNKISNITMGDNFFDIKKYDTKKNSFDSDLNFDIKNCDVNIDIDKHPICIQQILMNKDSGWKKRYLLILYFKELGYTRQEVYEILKQSLSDKKFRHCIKDERQLQYLFERDDLIFPTCNKIKMDELCPGKCKNYNTLIYK